MKLIHVIFEAFTATFKIPHINSGTLISSPVPSYSNIIGIISCCAGRYIDKNETMVGFKYSYKGKGIDIETTKRLMMDNRGMLKQNPQKGIAAREFHVRPRLDIYLSNLNFKKYFEKPVGVPTLGRSQDIAWITKIEEIEVEKVEEGKIKQTLIPFPCSSFSGRIIRFCDYFVNNNTGFLRKPSKMILYQVVPESKEGIYIKNNNLYKIKGTEEVIYMHKLGEVI